MSFLSELGHGRFAPQDLTSHFKEDLPYWMLAAGAVTGGIGLAGGFGGAAAGAAGAEAGALGLGAAEAGLGAEAGLTATEFLPGLTEATSAAEFFPGLEGAAESTMGLAEAGGGMTDFSSAVKGVADEAPAWLNSPQTAMPTGGADPITSMSGPLTPDKAGGGGGFMDKLWTGASKSITDNPLGTAAAGVGLASAMFSGDKNSAELQKIKEQAGQLGSQGAWLQQYLQNGTLPPGMQAQMNQATAAAKARIRSNHAKSGMGSDPSTNSALAQELNSVDINAVAAMAQSQLDMYKTGLNETGLSSQMYQYLVKLEREDNKELMNSIAKFAAALGGGSGKGKGNTFSITAN